MNLLKPLAVEAGRIHKIDLTNTEDGVTVVLLLQALCTVDTAEVVGLRWLFDENGNLNPFAGTVGADGELSGPEVSFLTRGGSKDMSFKAAKVAHFRVSKDKDDVVMTMRVHLPKADDKGVITYLEQLLRIKKAEIDVTITDAQMSLFDGRNGVPDEPRRLVTLDYHSEVGKRGEVRASIQLHHDKPSGRWYYGWTLRWSGPNMPPDAGMIVDVQGNSWQPERAAAIEDAGRHIVTILKDQAGGFGNAQLQASAKIMDWLLGHAPGLRKDGDGKPIVMPPPAPAPAAPPEENLEPGSPAGKKHAGRRGPKSREQVH